jgi:hypothetical protein
MVLLANSGVLAASAFALDNATGLAAQSVYNHMTGVLYFDSNGARTGGSRPSQRRLR